MKTKLLFSRWFALSFISICLIIASCNGSADKKAAKKLNDSIAATRHFDSMQNAIKAMQIQDSVAALKSADSTKKADSANVHK